MPENTNRSPKSFFRTWRYVFFWISSLLSNMGTWMQQIAEPWLVLNLSGSAFWVGLDGFSLNAPGLLFTLLGGVIADRFDRRRVVLFFQAIQFLFVAGLVTLLIAGWLKVWMIVCISFIVGLTDALSNPSFQTIVPSLVDHKDIPRAVSLSSTQFNLSRILGPVIAGIVIVRFGAVACFGANAASYFPYLLSVYLIYPRKRPSIIKQPIQNKPADQLREFWQLMLVPKIRLPLLTTFIANLFCGPIVTFSPVLIKNVFHEGVGDFGYAMASFGVGGLLGAGFSFVQLPKWLGRGRFAGLAAIVLALAMAGIAFNHSLQLLSLLLVIAGASLTTSNITVNTCLQERATNITRGRVASLYQLALYGGIALGALITGFTVSHLNISRAFAINGSLALLFEALLVWQELRAPVE